MKCSSVNDYENYASEFMEQKLKDLVMRGSQNNVTYRANLNAYKQYRIKPRYMRDVSKISLDTTLFGDKIKVPIGLSPTGFHALFHPNAEAETARGAREFGTIMVISCGTYVVMEELSAKEPNLIKWLQVYIYEDRQVTLDFVRRAEKLGFKAIVLTIDQPTLGLKFASTDPIMWQTLIKLYTKNIQYNPNYTKDTSKNLATDVTWSDLKWLKSQTHLPIMVKGVLSAEDARLAVDYGADAVVVSNHGGRQLDESPSTLDVLPEVVKEVGAEVPVLFDGGIRTGNDVFKALALGAKFVFIGRPAIYGLFHSGWEGVRSVLNILDNELKTVMMLSGCASLSDISHEYIQHVDRYRNRANVGVVSKL